MTYFNKAKTNLFASCIALSMLTGCLEKTSEESQAQDPAPVVVDGGSGSTNNPPSIAGTPPATIIYGSRYSFVPSASDPDGDNLSFSIANRPGWASFSSGSGEMSGTPSLADVGRYTNIDITVSDGQETASLGRFDIDVAQNADGSIVVTIQAPTQNVDGTALTDLAGYNIYYGPAEGDYPNQVRINTPGVSTYVIENLVHGQYYIVATAVNSQGLESDYSNYIIRVAN